MVGIGHLGRLRFRRFWRRNKWIIFLIFIVIPLFSILAFWGKKEIPLIVNKMEKAKVNPSAVSDDIFQAIREGDYDNTVNRLRNELNRNPENPALKKLWSQLMDELNVDVKFHYFIDRKSYKVTKDLSPELTLTPRDPYYLTVNPSYSCNLFVFQVDSTGKINVIYPNKEYSPSENPLLPGPLRIPDGFKWFYLDETKGIETIYLIASRLENNRLDELSRKLASEKEPEKAGRLTQELISYLKNLESTASSVPGVAIKVYQFTHDG